MAPFRTSDFHCFYKTDSGVCATAGRALDVVEQNVCSFADTTGERFCACTNNNAADVITGTIPTTDDQSPDDVSSSSSTGSSGDDVSSSSSTGSSGDLSGSLRSVSVGVASIALISVASLFSTISSSSRSSSSTVAMFAIIICIIAMVIVPSADAHNWVGNPSRATVASVTKPCQSRVGDQPHIQVNPGQTFQTEWSVGHGDSGTKNYYFVLVHADNYLNLLTATATDFETYIREAPNSAYQQNATMWKKRHITSTTDPDWVWGYFDKTPLAKNDSRYIARDVNMNLRGKIRYSGNNFNEYFFYPNHTTKDLRVEYTSAKYPWYAQFITLPYIPVYLANILIQYISCGFDI
jgi:hypothetical protein